MFKKRTFSDRQWIIGYIFIAVISVASFFLKKDTIEKQVAVASSGSTHMYAINQHLKFFKSSSTTPLSKIYINQLIDILHQAPIISYDSYLHLNLQLTIFNGKIASSVAYQNLDNPNYFNLFWQKNSNIDKQLPQETKTFDEYQKILFSENNLNTIHYGFSQYARELEKLDNYFKTYTPLKLFFVKNIEFNYSQIMAQKRFLFSSLLFKPENLDFQKYSIEQSLLLTDEAHFVDKNILSNLTDLHKQYPQDIQKLWDQYFSSKYGTEMNHFFKTSLEAAQNENNSQLSPSLEKEYLNNLQFWKNISLND